MIDLDEIQKQVVGLDNWLRRNAPHVAREQKHLDAFTAERAYWNYGRLVALKDILRQAGADSDSEATE